MLRLVGFGLATLVVLAGFVAAFEVMREQGTNRLLVAGIALVVGVGGVFLLFWAMDRVVNSLPAAGGSRPGPTCSWGRPW